MLPQYIERIYIYCDVTVIFNDKTKYICLTVTIISKLREQTLLHYLSHSAH